MAHFCHYKPQCYDSTYPYIYGIVGGCLTEVGLGQGQKALRQQVALPASITGYFNTFKGGAACIALSPRTNSLKCAAYKIRPLSTCTHYRLASHRTHISQ